MEVSELNCHILSSPTRGSKIHGQSKGLKTVAIIEVRSEEFVGLGEAYVGIYIPELTLKIVNHISSNIIGMDIETSMEKIRTFKAPFVSNAGIYKSILGSIEVALYDLQARIKEIPLYKLFSNDAFFPSLYASGGSVITSKRELDNDINLAKSKGLESFKMRIGKQSWKDDLNRVSHVRKHHQSMDLMVDAISGTRNPVWSFDESLEKFKSLEDFDLTWLEEPLSPEKLSDHFSLKNILNIPLAAGEAYTSETEFLGLIGIADIDIVQFDVTHSGGFSMAKTAYELAISSNKKSAFHVWGSLIAQMANYHLALSMKELFYFEVPLLELELNDYLIYSNETIFELVKKIPEDPGLGLFLDEKAINKFKFVPNTEYKW
tara:strand:+ start:1706 stop:2833 length:1128 start_codon:yes stop_codon:yes gene_type:complete